MQLYQSFPFIKIEAGKNRVGSEQKIGRERKRGTD